MKFHCLFSDITANNDNLCALNQTGNLDLTISIYYTTQMNKIIKPTFMPNIYYFLAENICYLNNFN